MQRDPSFRRIDKNKPIPLYYQIADDIKARIAKEELKPGDKLPTEQWLLEVYNVSRITIRRALSELIAAGIVDRVRGRGPVVANRKFNRRVLNLTGLQEELSNAGLVSTSRVSNISRKPGKALDARHLELEDGEMVLSFCRIRYGNGQPIASQVIYLPDALCPGFDPMRLENDSLYRILEDDYGLKIDYANQTLGVKVPSKKQLAALELRDATGLLQMARTTYLDTGRVIEFTEICYVPGRYEISMCLYR
ncbi:GntR family transcriptional regulator [Shumkonia mesophila]|uniref:GntR family transcriptional regulator n=1 Tax=Shumkonia mesophila TaxID=2838854 RepID=UPI0029347F39|nr:GntR family transcriptional regulator [Shumkonia mesophila]